MEWVYWVVGGYLIPAVLCYLLTRRAIKMGVYVADLEALVHCLVPGVNILFTLFFSLFFSATLPKYVDKKTIRRIFLLKD
ncbi:hypothetical protein Goe16_01870 [Bacillus phage vB_BsuM-Goe16]|nr:hypothetical protein Goe16_01870 [Bacillus phage vB_BsuM-Goe16]